MFEFEIREDCEQTEVEMIRFVRGLVPLSVSEIRTCIREGGVVLRIETFSTAWEEERLLLARLTQGIINKSVPFRAYHVHDGVREALSSELLKNYVVRLRGIELDDECLSALKFGEIEKPEDFISDQPDWTGFEDVDKAI